MRRGAGKSTTMRVILAAVPCRLPVLWSKIAAFGLTALVLGTAGAFVSFLGGEHFLAGQRIALTLSSPGVLRCLAAAGVYLGLVAVMGIALGALLRSVAGGIAALIGVARYAHVTRRGVVLLTGAGTVTVIVLVIFRVPHMQHVTPFAVFFLCCTAVAATALGLARRHQ
jgi:hypothetical protein